MITLFEDFRLPEIKVRDYVLIASEDSGIDPDGNIGVWGDPAIVVTYEKK